MAEHNREYYLMHKDIPVCLMEISMDLNAQCKERSKIG